MSILTHGYFFQAQPEDAFSFLNALGSTTGSCCRDCHTTSEADSINLFFCSYRQLIWKSRPSKKNIQRHDDDSIVSRPSQGHWATEGCGSFQLWGIPYCNAGGDARTALTAGLTGQHCDTALSAQRIATFATSLFQFKGSCVPPYSRVRGQWQKDWLNMDNTWQTNKEMLCHYWLQQLLAIQIESEALLFPRRWNTKKEFVSVSLVLEKNKNI